MAVYIVGHRAWLHPATRAATHAWLHPATRVATYALLYKGLLLYLAEPSTPIAYLLLSYNNYLFSQFNHFYYTIGTLVAIGSYDSFGLPATYPP